MAKQAVKDLVLRVELLGVEPLVWRRVRVPAKFTLRQLHGVIQVAMSWQDCHLHEYRVGVFRIGLTDRPELDVPEGMEDETEWSVADVVKTGVGEFDYVYDFGDRWVHRVVLEPASRSRSEGASPLCLAGENACPPEDVGGYPGYAEFRAALADASHPQHDTYVSWVGGVWDPKGFDLNRVNRELMKPVCATLYIG
jgi:hypothetical protein